MYPTKIPLIFLPVLLTIQLEAQLQVTVTIENQYNDGTNFYFDIFLRRTSSPGNGDVYLGHADFVLTFNFSNFSNPSLLKVGNAPGFCDFSPTISNGSNDDFTSRSYFNNITTTISDNFLRINLNGPGPSDQDAFNTTVAKIDNLSLKHRLGRFMISGISNSSGTAGLQWKTSGTGISTSVFSLENTAPFQSVSASLVAVDPADALLPVELISFEVINLDDQTNQLEWKTASEINNQGFEIERKADTATWHTLGTVLPKSDGNYVFIDQKPFQGTNYYRLKQIDFDGTFTYSPIRSVYIENQDPEIYPNPVTSVLFVPGESGAYYRVMDINGRQHKDGILKDQFLDLSELPTGSYILWIDGKNKKLIKW
jgi:hypothetical protein